MLLLFSYKCFLIKNQMHMRIVYNYERMSEKDLQQLKWLHFLFVYKPFQILISHYKIVDFITFA